VEESAAGQFLYPAFGTDIARRPVRNNDTLNTANTNVVPHAGRLYALWEGGSATELDAASLASTRPLCMAYRSCRHAVFCPPQDHTGRCAVEFWRGPRRQ
jgi:hypothetical protein